MRIIVNPHKIDIVKDEAVNEKELNISKCVFEFDERITREFTKEAYFTLKGKTYKQMIFDNECDFPYEVLTEKGDVEIGVVAFYIDDLGRETRFNPSPAFFNTWNGSLRDAENTKPITPSEIEQFEQRLNKGIIKVDDKIVELDERFDAKIEEIDTEVSNKINEVDERIAEIDDCMIQVNQAIEETNNLNIEVSDKIDNKVNIRLTKKDGSQKEVFVSDGVSLEYNWKGTKLGIKREDEALFDYTDLKGETGDFNFATFEIDFETGELVANKTENLELINFALNEQGYMEVIING